MMVHGVKAILCSLPTPPVGHQHGCQERSVGVLYLHKPGRVGNLLTIELDIHPVPAEVVGDEVRLELFLGHGVNMTGHPTTIHNYFQIAKPGAPSLH